MGFCGNCGAARTSETDQFCRACGTPYPQPTAPIPPAGAAPTQPVPPPPGTPPPPVVPGAPVSRGGPRPALILAAVGVTLALVVTGIVLWQVLKPRGGAETPEAAVEELVLAAADQDPVAAVDYLNPPEVDQIEGIVATALERGEDAELVTDGGLGDALTIELTDLELDVEELGDDMAWVTVTDGHYELDFDPDALPAGFDDFDLDEVHESGDIADELDGEDVSLMTIRTDGRWYVTLVGTMAHYAYLDAAQWQDLDEPDWEAVSADVDPIVGDDPEAAIENLVDAIDAGDVTDLLSTLPEGYARPLRPYAPMLQEAMDGAIASSGGLEVSVSGLELAESDAEGDLVRVVVEEGRVEADVDGESSGFEIRGECVETWDSWGSNTACLSDLPPAFRTLFADEIYLMMRETDGGYQLDPVATQNAYLQHAIEEFDRDLFEDFFEDLLAEIASEW